MLLIVVMLNFNLLDLLILSGLIVSLPLGFCLTRFCSVSLAAGSGWHGEKKAELVYWGCNQHWPQRGGMQGLPPSENFT